MEKKKKDYLSITLGMQFLICLIIFGILFALKSTNNSLLSDLKEVFSNKLSENITLEEAVSVYSGLKGNSDSTENSEKPQETESTKENEKNKETEETYVPFEEPSLSAEVIAGGGEDIKVDSEKDIPENVSVSDYVLNKKMTLPVIGGKITSEFGVRTHPISNDLRFHAGIDIASPLGTPIYSAFDGKVIRAEYDQWNGNIIKLQHENGIMTVYCHCESLNVKKGQNIRAGEVIGYVGSTGISTGPHLHFELRLDNVSYNPEKALKEAVNAV